jgi:hypothetical protein
MERAVRLWTNPQRKAQDDDQQADADPFQYPFNRLHHASPCLHPRAIAYWLEQRFMQ